MQVPTQTTQRSITHQLNVAPAPTYRTEISLAAHDPEWDQFLLETPGGHHVQTSLWGQVRLLAGWRVKRVIVRQENGAIVGGGQLLIRPFPVGAVGYVTRGPVIAGTDPALAKLVIDQIHEAACAEQVQILIVQPPGNGHWIAERLPDWGFRQSSISVTPTATVFVDLTPDLDTILSRMQKKTRKCIRRGLRSELTVRQGTILDVPRFYQLYRSTSDRQGFVPFSEEYFMSLWHIFSPGGHINMTFVEYQDEPVAVELQIMFGDMVSGKAVGWSGKYGNMQPNEVLHWGAFEWAKAQGYRLFDFEGITPESARAILNNEPTPKHSRQTFSSFKLGFSKQVEIHPEPYEYIYNPFLRWGYYSVVSNLTKSDKFWKLVMYLRAR